MDTLELTKRLKAKIEKALSMTHSPMADNYLKGELGIILLYEDFLENGVIPDIIERDEL